MNIMDLIIRSSLLRNRICPTKCVMSFKSTFRFNSSKSESSDDEKSKKDIPKNQQALNKLNLLLQQMVNENVKQETSKLDLAKPKNRRQQAAKKSDEVVETQQVEKQVVTAVKDVAEHLGGDVKRTESELLMKLLHQGAESAPSSSSLSDLVKGMKIDRETKTPEMHSRAQQVKDILQNAKPYQKDKPTGTARRFSREPRLQGPAQVVEKIDLFGSEPLGIFKKKDAEAAAPVNSNKTWDKLYERELQLAVTHPPSSYFQEMILWTEQGKLWKFPIDNEQGLEKEQNTYFTEHIFLEKHLEDWCPAKGPVRHFMELVCVGLSKNPYLTVEAKKEHIEWYKNYFEDKRKILEELGAITAQKKLTAKKHLPRNVTC